MVSSSWCHIGFETDVSLSSWQDTGVENHRSKGNTDYKSQVWHCMEKKWVFNRWGISMQITQWTLIFHLHQWCSKIPKYIERFQNNFHRLVEKIINDVFFMTSTKNVSAYIWNLVSKGQKALRILLITLLSCCRRFLSNIAPFSTFEAAIYKIPNQQSNRLKVGKG